MRRENHGNKQSVEGHRPKVSLSWWEFKAGGRNPSEGSHIPVLSAGRAALAQGIQQEALPLQRDLQSPAVGSLVSFVPQLAWSLSQSTL